MRRYLNGICKGEADADKFPLAVAALGPLMLKLSGEMTRGALPYNTNPRHTEPTKASATCADMATTS